MNRHLVIPAVFCFLFLIIVQAAGILVESIYIIDLMNTSLDEKALGLLFFFSPLILLGFKLRSLRAPVWIAFVALFLGRAAIPYLDTLGRMLASGVATGAGLILFIFLLMTTLKSNRQGEWLAPAQGLAAAISLSILLRSVNYTLDISLDPSAGYVGWGLGVILGGLLTQIDIPEKLTYTSTGKGVTSGVVGMLSIITLAYFAYFSPGVIARWTEGNYALIVILVSFLSLAWIFTSLLFPGLIGSMQPARLVIWNILFTIVLTGLILSHSIRFPATPESPVVSVAAPAWYQQALLLMMLLLFPVIYLDFAVFAGVIARANPSPRRLVGSFIIGILFLILLVFMNIFTNVWGYVEPVSTLFRNKYWLPFLLMAGVQTILVSRLAPGLGYKARQGLEGSAILIPGGLIAGVFAATLAAVLLTNKPVPAPAEKTSLKVMTYNIQQANDDDGEKSYQRQLALIHKVNPDFLALQESDSARISLGNNDYVRYYAGKLGYRVYYGPNTVTGTFGTAILSRYPIDHARTIFSYSDQDEIGTVEVQISVDGERFTIYNVHPDGSDKAMSVFAQTLLDEAAGKPNVIALGDYNLREQEAAYQLIAGVYKNAWMEVYPNGIGADGLDMSGDRRIDHIFVSQNLTVQYPVYLLAPESATDHPAHWAEITWR